MNGKERYGRRYSFKVAGSEDLFDPADFNMVGAYNPGNLNKEARAVARKVAAVFNTEVTVVKHLAQGDREEGFYR